MIASLMQPMYCKITFGIYVDSQKEVVLYASVLAYVGILIGHGNLEYEMGILLSRFAKAQHPCSTLSFKYYGLVIRCTYHFYGCFALEVDVLIFSHC